MASRRKDAVVSADSHEGSEEADHPQAHSDYPCDDVWAILRNTKDLKVEERDRDLDETNGEDACDDERIVVLVVI